MQGSNLAATDQEVAERAMHVLAVLDTTSPPAASPVRHASGDADDTPVHASPLTFAISEATASATIREMTRRGEPSTTASPIRSQRAGRRPLTPTKELGGAAAGRPGAAAVPGVPLTVAADMRLLSAPAAELHRWLTSQRASGRFQEYGCLRAAGGAPGRV